MGATHMQHPVEPDRLICTSYSERVSADPWAVNCEYCRNSQAWQDAAKAAHDKLAALVNAADEFRAAGWSVAVHNDYRLNGEPHTFWLFTHPRGRWVKGEGRTDAEALAQVRSAIGAGVVHDEDDDEVAWCAICNVMLDIVRPGSHQHPDTPCVPLEGSGG
jgi:hypothetical protein